MGAYSKPRVVNQKRCDKRNDSSLARGKRFPRFSYVFVSTFVGFLLFGMNWVQELELTPATTAVCGSGFMLWHFPNAGVMVRIASDSTIRRRYMQLRSHHCFDHSFCFLFSNINAASHADTHASKASSCVLICASAIIQSVERALLNYSCFRFQEASGEDG